LFVWRMHVVAKWHEAFFNTFTKKGVADSAGTMPAKTVNPVAIQVMKEVGINISHYNPKSLTFDMNKRFDFIVTMGCIDGCPITPRDKTIEWHIEDPSGKPIEQFRLVRDDIMKHVEELIREVID
jgi:arsenate reductase